jgi:SAM-dependent methyltransferase
VNNYWEHVNPNEFLQTSNEGYHKPVRQLYRALLTSLRISDMLEVGCGPGVDYAGAVNTRAGIRYTGVDMTPNMVNYCKLKYPHGNFVQGDIHKLPFPDNRFQLVYCKDVLNHLDDWGAGISELYRVSSKYVLVNFFYGLGSRTFKGKEQHDGFLNHWVDWNEVMTKLVSFKPVAINVYPLDCNPNEETMILLQK